MAAIVAGDILFKYSVSAAAGNTTAQATPALSLGDQISTSAWGGGSINDLFDDVTGAENAAAAILDYRCIFVHNNNGLNIFQNVVVWLQSEVSGGATIALAADTTAASPIGQASTQALTAASETAPGSPITSLSYSSPTTSAAGVVLGNIGTGQCKAFWIRRTTTNSAALTNDGVTIAVTGDTGAL